MRCGQGFEASVWLLLIAIGGAPLVGCGGRSHGDGATSGGASGGDSARSGAGGATPPSGGSAGSTEEGGAADEPPPPVDPEVSRAWAWQPCGTLHPEGADRAARFDASGRIVVLGPNGVRVHESTGARAGSSSGVQADFLVTAADGSVLSGRSTGAGIALTPVGESTPSIVLPEAPAGVCGSQFAMSADGAHVLATDPGLACAWRVSDSSFVGSVSGEQVTIRNAHFVAVERGRGSTDIVQRDFAGHELSRRQLADGPVFLSPAGDRAITLQDDALVDLDSGKVVALDVAPQLVSREPRFSPRGEMVLLGDGVFSTADGVRRFRLDPTGRLGATVGPALELSPDGNRALSCASGRATLFDVEAKGVSAVLGPPVLSDPTRGEGTSDLAISRDGTLLVQNIVGASAFGIRLAPSFGDSRVIWDMWVELNLSVDVSGDGRLAAIGGDGRAIYDGRDGHEVWTALPPPSDVSVTDFCLLDRLRFSPKATFLAGSDYSHKLQIFPMASAEPWRPLVELPGSCDAPAFSRDERLMATSAAALYRTGASPSDWTLAWSSPLPTQASASGYAASDVAFSPDETQLLVSRCTLQDACVTTLLNAATGAVSRQLTELDGPHPAFSPEGSWIVAGNKLLHLASGEVRTLGAGASATNPALFTPEGDVIASSADGALTRFCRSK